MDISFEFFILLNLKKGTWIQKNYTSLKKKTIIWYALLKKKKKTLVGYFS